MATIEKHTQDVRNETDAQRKKEIAVVEQNAEANSKLIREKYEAQIADEYDSYDKLLRQNELQKLVNERAIERKSAEMGLTDSGFNRTQQTASQIAYANQNGEYQLQLQKSVDTLASTMNANLLNEEIKKNDNIAQIDAEYEDNALAIGTQRYNAEVEAEIATATAEREAAEVKSKTEDELIEVLIDPSIPGETKIAKYKFYESKYGETDILERLGYRFKASGEITDQPYSIYDFDYNIYLDNKEKNNGEDYSNAVHQALIEMKLNNKSVADAEKFLVENVSMCRIQQETYKEFLTLYQENRLEDWVEAN